MKVIDIEDIIGTEREVRCPRGGFISYRYLIRKDGLGFSLHHTFVPAGDSQHWHYKHHLEACYCLSGLGKLTDLSNNKIYQIKPGMVYALDSHDDHEFQALKDTILISVFNPALEGGELHDEQGSY